MDPRRLRYLLLALVLLLALAAPAAGSPAPQPAAGRFLLVRQGLRALTGCIRAGEPAPAHPANFGTRG